MSRFAVRSLSLVGLIVLGACASPEMGDPGAESALADSPDVSLAAVQRAIKAAGASWKAGDNAVSALPPDVRRVMLGIPLSQLPEERLTVVHEANELAVEEALLPVDWRNKDGKNFVSPIIDQGRCGSCVAFSTVATFETQLNIAAGDPTSPWQLSPDYLFSCGGGGCGFGWFPSSAVGFVVRKGVPDLACMPTTSSAHGDDASCSAACGDVTSRAVKARGSFTPTGGATSVDRVKAALQKGPLEASMTVYEDFMFYTGGVYKHVTGARAGGHAVSIVGYSDDDKAWIARNSWGTGWGESGFFRIAWGDASGVGEQTWGFDVSAPGPYVAVADLRDNAVLSGVRELAFNAQSLGDAPISWSLMKGTTEVATGLAVAASSTFDTTTVPDGVYVLRPHAGQGASRIEGAPHVVYVLNGAESGNMKFTTLHDGQTLTGTVTFDIAMAASPVPATQMQWTVTDANGQVLIDRTSENTGALMQLGWNTKRRPNGAYTMTVAGRAGTQALESHTLHVTLQN